jgi:hypothetical protein
MNRLGSLTVRPATLEEAIAVMNAVNVTIDAFASGPRSPALEELRQILVHVSREVHATITRNRDRPFVGDSAGFDPECAEFTANRPAFVLLLAGLEVLSDWAEDPDAAAEDALLKPSIDALISRLAVLR